MIKRRLALLTLAAPALAAAIEEPAYEVIRTVQTVEIRQYAPYVVAEVRVQASAEEAGNQAFPILAGYIFGKNKGERKLEMTAPVTQTAAPMKMAMTAPVTQAPVDGGYLVQFVLPRDITLATAPVPLDSRVMLREVPVSRVAAIRYSGFWSDANYQDNLARLKEALRTAGIAHRGEPVLSRYDPPFMPLVPAPQRDLADGGLSRRAPGPESPQRPARSPVSAPCPEIAVQCRDLALGRGHRADDRHGLLPTREDIAAGQVERGVFGVGARQRQQGAFFHAVDQAADVRPVLRARAHGAGLHGGHQRAIPQELRRVHGGRVARQHRLGVVHGVHVALLEQHRFPVGRHQQRAEGVVACRQRRRRDGVGAPQVAQRLLVGHAVGHALCEPRWAQPVVRFSIHEKNSYITMAIAPMVTRPAKASGMRCWLPALCIR